MTKLRLTLPLTVLAIFLAPAIAAGDSVLTVACSALRSQACSVVPQDSPVPSTTPFATATYSDRILNTSGWWTLDASASISSPDVDTAEALMTASFALGVVEGALSCREVLSFASNVLQSDFGNGPNAGPNAALLQFIEANDAWVHKMVLEHAKDDDYWLAIGQLMSQMEGILVGVNEFSNCSSTLTRLDLLLVNLDGDLFDLQSAYPSSSSSSQEEGEEEPSPNGVVSRRHHRFRGDVTGEEVGDARELRCSALFKLAEDQSDIFFGHSTWDTYATAAPRIYKNLRMPLRREGQMLSHVDSFSSSPGFIASIDDYYVLDGTSALVVIETSNGVYNTSAYEFLAPESVLCWLRTMAANMLSTDAKSWTGIFSKYHSGTYNNQWMVLDPAKFSPATLLDSSDLFWVLEEAPGLIHAEDQTEALVNDGYWASYNVAYYDDVRDRIGETASYDSCPRANLFREMQGNVTDLVTMSWIMGWNDYENDALSLNNPGNAIMARDDLKGYAAGGIDSKCSSIAAIRGDEDGASAPLLSMARAGPTHGPLPVFCWEDLPASTTPHEGHPPCFNYSWASVQPL